MVDATDLYHKIGQMSVQPTAQGALMSPAGRSSGRGNNIQGVSQLAFGEYRLPSTVDAMPEAAKARAVAAHGGNCFLHELLTIVIIA